MLSLVELVLYPATLLKLFISCRIFLVHFLGLPMYTIVSFGSRYSHFFVNLYPLSILFCLIFLARTSSTVLNRYGKRRQPCLVPNFSRIASSISPFIFMLAVGVLYIALIMFKYWPLVAEHSSSFNMEKCCILSNAFLASKEMIR
jgi:hypothetical protein